MKLRLIIPVPTIEGDKVQLDLQDSVRHRRQIVCSLEEHVSTAEGVAAQDLPKLSAHHQLMLS